VHLAFVDGEVDAFEDVFPTRGGNTGVEVFDFQ
jgi:hypothetical protein